jgi:hypothetical protein
VCSVSMESTHSISPRALESQFYVPWVVDVRHSGVGSRKRTRMKLSGGEGGAHLPKTLPDLAASGK